MVEMIEHNGRVVPAYLLSSELEDVESFITIWGEDITLGELRDALKEKEELLGD